MNRRINAKYLSQKTKAMISGLVLLAISLSCTKNPQTPEVVPFTITTSVSPTGSGSTSPASAAVNRNDDLSITASPNKSGHYHFLKWVPDSGLTIDGALDSATWVRNVTRSGIVTALFGIDSFSVTMSTNFGTVTPSGTVSIPYNQGFAITASNAPRGYRFKQWTKTGALTIVNASISSTTISNVTSNGTVAAEFEEISVPSNVLCVDSQSVASAPDGTTWARAYSKLQDALAAAGTGTRKEIWVAKGTYWPAATDQYFDLLSGTNVYGGFSTSEILRTQRDWKNNNTTLSGIIPTKGLADVIVMCQNAQSNIAIDGFTIDSATYYGIWINDANRISVSNCLIQRSQNGCSIFDSDTISIVNCVFTRNYASVGAGLELWPNADKVSVYNCVMYKNFGSAIYAGNESTDLFNVVSSTIAFNRDPSGSTGGVVNKGNVSLVNTILWGNSGGLASNGKGSQIDTTNWVKFCCIQNGDLSSLDRGIGRKSSTLFIENGAVYKDPLFYDGSNGSVGADWFTSVNTTGLRLQPLSPCINVGGALVGIPFLNSDIRGIGRSGSTIDIGAYEMP